MPRGAGCVADRSRMYASGGDPQRPRVASGEGARGGGAAAAGSPYDRAPADGRPARDRLRMPWVAARGAPAGARVRERVCALPAAGALLPPRRAARDAAAAGDRRVAAPAPGDAV